MNVDEALTRARELMDSHGLVEWELGLSRGVRTLGQTLLVQKKIVISQRHIELNDWEHVGEVVLHEIAHAIAHDRHGWSIKAHGPEWRAAAKHVGCKQIAHSMRGHVSVEARYRGVCRCGTPHSRHRMGKGGASGYVCKKCSGPIQWTDTQTGRDLL